MTQPKIDPSTPKSKAGMRKSAKKAATTAKSSTAKATKVGAASREGARGLEAKPVRNLKIHTRRLIAEQFSEIMESMAEKSKRGSLAHAKFLFEIGGVKEDLARAQRGKAEPSLADLLMGGVKLRQAANAAELEHSLKTGDESVLSHDEDKETGEGAAD